MPGMDYVMHVASPFPAKPPKHENEVINPALEGTRNVLNAAIKHGIKKVVLTSSVAAIYSGHGRNK
jgi:nucleoside-diphosphate-sugar epimerase